MEGSHPGRSAWGCRVAGRRTGRGKSPLVVRQDGYVVDGEKRWSMLKDFGLELEFAGALRWGGKGVGSRYTATGSRTLSMPLSRSRWALRRLRMATSHGTSFTARGGRSKPSP